MGGHPLVEVEELVGLGAVAWPAPASSSSRAHSCWCAARRRRGPRAHRLRRSDPRLPWNNLALPRDATISRTSSAASYAGVDQLVTGEAVALELPPASLGLRIVSGLIDVTIEFGILVLGTILATVLLPTRRCSG